SSAVTIVTMAGASWTVVALLAALVTTLSRSIAEDACTSADSVMGWSCNSGGTSCAVAGCASPATMIKASIKRVILVAPCRAVPLLGPVARLALHVRLQNFLAFGCRRQDCYRPRPVGRSGGS